MSGRLKVSRLQPLGGNEPEGTTGGDISGFLPGPSINYRFAAKQSHPGNNASTHLESPKITLFFLKGAPIMIFYVTPRSSPSTAPQSNEEGLAGTRVAPPGQVKQSPDSGTGRQRGCPGTPIRGWTVCVHLRVPDAPES